MVNLEKFKRRIRGEWVARTRNKPFYYYLYRSYWHKKLFAPQLQMVQNYLSIIPNRGAGIGHQLANWNAGLFYANFFGLKYASAGFSNNWNKVIGLDHSLPSTQILLSKGYRKVQLPYFKEDDPFQIQEIRNIIASYGNQRVLFYLEYDQAYRDQVGVSQVLKSYFFSSPSRENDRLIFDKNDINICVHVRRGDIIVQGSEVPENLRMRFQSNNYFTNIIQSLVSAIPGGHSYKIFIFSQGNEADFPEFNKFEHVKFCLDMDAYNSFIHFIHADILVTSKSSFSYKPALISEGIKICPRNFWHGYLETSDFILAEDNGNFNKDELQKELLKRTKIPQLINTFT
jgi:hypothetical protein